MPTNIKTKFHFLRTIILSAIAIAIFFVFRGKIYFFISYLTGGNLALQFAIEAIVGTIALATFVIFCHLNQKKDIDTMMQQLAESKEKFEVLSNLSPDCIKLVDKNRKIIYMNPGGLKEHHFKTLEEAIGLDMVFSVVEEQRPYIMEAFNKCINEGKTISAEVNHKQGASNHEWCDFAMTPVKDGYGQITSVLAISRDISELKTNRAKEFALIEDLKNKISDLNDAREAILNVAEDAEEEKQKTAKEKNKAEALARELEKFKLAVDNVSDQIIITDSDGIVIYVNNATEKITGYQAQEAIGQKSGKLWGHLMGKSFYEHLWKTIKIDKKTFIGEITNKRKNNETYSAILNISPILDEHKNIIFFVGIERDISFEKEIDKAKTEFVSLASHQLRTPLSGTKWLIETLQREVIGKMTKKQKEYIDRLYQINERMIQLVASILDVMRLESKSAILNKEQTTTSKIFTDILAMEKDAAKSVGVIFSMKSSTDIAFETDIQILETILESFVSNAIAYSHKGSKIILDTKEEGDNILFSVTDFGIGIPQSEKIHIFDKFYRASNAKVLKPSGTGLGLYIAKLFAENLNGKVWFESQENKGTTFYLRVPRSME